MYIDEMVDLIINAAISNERETINLIMPSIQTDQIASIFEDIYGRRINAEVIDHSPGIDDPEFLCDIEDLYSDWVRSIPLRQAIKKIIELSAESKILTV